MRQETRSQAAPCFWITGLAGSGKTTLAIAAVDFIRQTLGQKVVLVDGDLIREIMGHTLEYDKESRLRIAYKIAALCKNISDQNVPVICATISLFKDIHEWNHRNIQNYHDIYVDVSFDELLRRDKKQLYSRAKRGEEKNVVGVDIPFDRPAVPKLTINNEKDQQLSIQNLNHYIEKVLLGS